MTVPNKPTPDKSRTITDLRYNAVNEWGEADEGEAVRLSRTTPYPLSTCRKAVDRYGIGGAEKALAFAILGHEWPPEPTVRRLCPHCLTRCGRAIGEPCRVELAAVLLGSGGSGWQDQKPAATPESANKIIADMERAGFAIDPEKTCAVLGIPTLLTKPDPRSERERRRAEIDAVLREDARRFPAFAMARRVFVLAAFERTETCPERARGLLSMCHAYERKRGGMMKPNTEAIRYRDGCDMFDDYERARHL